MLAAALAMAAVWFGGPRLGWPKGLRLALAALVWAAYLLALAVLPGAERRALVEWALLGPLALAVWLYARWVSSLKARHLAAATPAAPEPGGLSPAELARYSRHILLPDIGGPGQRRLKAARVLVIGAGGLGAPVLEYLAAAGAGTIGVIDDDTVDASNLHRQVIHGEADIGRPKVFSAVDRLAAQNPHVALRPYNRRLTEEIAAGLFADYDLVLDGTDSFDTRYLANVAAVRAGIPLVSGALTQWEGQLSTYDPARGAPCYACVFPERPAPGLVPVCAEAGVAGPLPGVIGTMMAMEALRLLTGAGENLRGRLVIWDGLSGEEQVIRVRRRPGCPVCGEAAGPAFASS